MIASWILGVIGRTPALSKKGAGATNGLLLGLGLATWMEFYTYDGVNRCPIWPAHSASHRIRQAGF